MSVSVALTDACSTTGEGPHWDEGSQSLYFVDILNGGVHQWFPSTNQHKKQHLNDTVSFVVPRQQGGLMVGLGRTISSLDFSTGKTEVIVEVDKGTKNRFNDAKCDPCGRLWAGTMGYDNPDELGTGVERNMGTLFSLDKSRKLTSHISQIDISNGMAWSKDQTVFYFIDSLPRKVYAFDFDTQSGLISNQRTAINLADLDSESLPDGMCIDNDGKLWIACFNGSKVVRYDPQTAQLLQTVILPTSRVTSCCFGGPNLDELYVTSCKTGLTPQELSKQPLAGSVFKVTGLGVEGESAVMYQG